MRPTWDDVWMQVAETIATRSRCTKNQVGSVIVSADGRTHFAGFNGPPASMPTEGPCREWCPQGFGGGSACYSIHAEINALLHSNREAIQDGTIYVTTAPCLKCACAVANSGVRRLVCPAWSLDADPRAEFVLMQSGLEVIHP